MKGRLPTALVAAAAVVLPVLSTVAHGDSGLGSSGPNQEVAVTGHELPDPGLHLEALSGIVELHCPGCLLDKREVARATDPGCVAKPKERPRRRSPEMTARRPLELPAYRSPRAPPVA